MTQTLHHAVVIDGDRSEALLRARVHVTDVLSLTIEANPDVSIGEFDRFGVDDARALKERASQTPLGDRQVFVVAAQSLTREAQNGLLKLLEEPPQDTHFILVVPTIELLLTTVRSRVQHLGTVRAPQDTAFAAEFYTATIGERITMLSKIVADKDRPAARAFLDALESYLHERGVLREKDNLAELAFVRQYITDTSSSVKMLLEHVAVTMQST
jgi:hypothetical protein